MVALTDLSETTILPDQIWEEEQTAVDVAHMVVWVDSKTAAGNPPTDEELIAELERHIYQDDSMLTIAQAEAAARARKGL